MLHATIEGRGKRAAVDILAAAVAVRVRAANLILRGKRSNCLSTQILTAGIGEVRVLEVGVRGLGVLDGDTARGIGRTAVEHVVIKYDVGGAGLRADLARARTVEDIISEIIILDLVEATHKTTVVAHLHEE